MQWHQWRAYCICAYCICGVSPRCVMVAVSKMDRVRISVYKSAVTPSLVHLPLCSCHCHNYLYWSGGRPPELMLKCSNTNKMATSSTLYMLLEAILQQQNCSAVVNSCIHLELYNMALCYPGNGWLVQRDNLDLTYRRTRVLFVKQKWDKANSVIPNFPKPFQKKKSTTT